MRPASTVLIMQLSNSRANFFKFSMKPAKFSFLFPAFVLQ